MYPGHIISTHIATSRLNEYDTMSNLCNISFSYIIVRLKTYREVFNHFVMKP